MGTWRRRAWSGKPQPRFADAVPRWRDRRELRRQFRAVARAVRGEDRQRVTRDLRRLVSDRVPVAFVGRGPLRDRTVEFTDGTHLELDIPEGEWGLWHLGGPLHRTAPYLGEVEPCLRPGWYWFSFSVAGREDLIVRARVDDFESTELHFKRGGGRWPQSRGRMS